MLLGVMGCRRAEKAANSAHLVLVNVSDCAWRIAISSGRGAEPRSWTVEPRQIIEADVPAGDYEVEQVLLTAEGAAAETRRLSVRLDRRQDYHWRLATLLSVPR